MTYLHMDEARAKAWDFLHEWIKEQDPNVQVLLVDDLFGKLRVIVWDIKKDQALTDLESKLRKTADIWWTGDVRLFDKDGPEAPAFQQAWEEAQPAYEFPERLRLSERHRNRGAWFQPVGAPLWRTRGDEEPQGPPVVVFYSFKGGLGRSTALVSFAIRQTRAGKRVAVLDFDLDAPGVGLLLAADEKGTTARWGVVDYLLENEPSAPFEDYLHPCRRPGIVGEGEILVFPAGKLDEAYPGKLARVDLEPSARGPGHDRIASFLEATRDELNPDWILLDARTGLSEPAGALLSGAAHLHVLFGSTSEQSWRGLALVLERLGADRVRAGQMQLDCLLAHALVPPHSEVARRARELFATRARDEFSEHYYAEPSAETPVPETWWTVDDLDTDDAPHVPVPLSYDPKLAHFRDILDIADPLVESPEYVALAERIEARFVEATE